MHSVTCPTKKNRRRKANETNANKSANLKRPRVVSEIESDTRSPKKCSNTGSPREDASVDFAHILLNMRSECASSGPPSQEQVACALEPEIGGCRNSISGSALPAMPDNGLSVIEKCPAEQVGVPPMSKPPTARFPEKLYEILSRKEFSATISWLPHGRAWKVHDEERLMEKIAPEYFRQKKYPSFVRQVYLWGFAKCRDGAGRREDSGAFHHTLFLRDEPHLCRTMILPKTPSKKDEDKRAETGITSEPDDRSFPMQAPSTSLPIPSDVTSPILPNAQLENTTPAQINAASLLLQSQSRPQANAHMNSPNMLQIYNALAASQTLTIPPDLNLAALIGNNNAASRMQRSVMDDRTLLQALQQANNPLAATCVPQPPAPSSIESVIRMLHSRNVANGGTCSIQNFAQALQTLQNVGAVAGGSSRLSKAWEMPIAGQYPFSIGTNSLYNNRVANGSRNCAADNIILALLEKNAWK